MHTIDTKINSIKKITTGLLNYSESFSFAIRDDIIITSHDINRLIHNLSNYQLEEKTVNKWPGTELLLGSAKLYFFSLTIESAAIISEYEDYLYKWIHPKLPEDLIFYREQRPVFVSITHENDAYFELNDDEIDIFSKRGLM